MNNAYCKGLYRKLVEVNSCLVFTCMLLLIVGCAGTPPVALPTARLEAIRHIQHGIKAEARGESPQALEEFAEALRISSSIENHEGIVVALVNSSRVHRHNGYATAALALISGALPHVSPQDKLYSEVAFEMAQVQMLSGELDAAYKWSSQAVAAENGSQRGMKLNLLARILYLKGNVVAAEVTVRDALLLNVENEIRGEEANSFRLLGDIQAATQRVAEAAESYNKALVIDKDLAKSSKIASDLRGLARLSLVRNDLDQALAIYQRAFAVSSAGGDRSGAADDLLNMSRIHEKRGEKERAVHLLAERDKLLNTPRVP